MSFITESERQQGIRINKIDNIVYGNMISFIKINIETEKDHGRLKNRIQAGNAQYKQYKA